MNNKSNSRIRKFLNGMTLGGMILALCFGLSHPPAVHAQGAWTGTPAETGGSQEASAIPLETSFTLDGVLVSVRASSMPLADFTVSEPGSASQVATSVTWKPFREFSVVAVPFGSIPATEALPAAGSGLKPAYDTALRNYRIQQGGTVQDGQTVTLFGQQVAGLHSLVDLYIDGPVPKPVIIDEWVVEAGDRLWIIRSSEEQVTSGPAQQGGNIPGDIVLSSSTLNNPSTVNNQPTKNPATEFNQKVRVDALPTPAWWQGDCDNDNYILKSGGVASYRLGAVYIGVPACGPRPYYDHVQDVLVHFFHGSWGELEWECVEYAMRFLYLLYGISPYQANGSQVVWNYSGNQLVQISNGTPSQAPVPNDVLSYGSTSTGGHTSVVTASNVDENGNGTITVIEQDASVSGTTTLTVTDWSVAGNAGSVSGWLHSTTPPPTLSVTKSGSGAGTVTSNPPGIDCGQTCSHAFYFYNDVVLTASAASGSSFAGWSGAGCSGTGTCSVTMSSDQSVTATFNSSGDQTLTVSKNGTGGGTVTSDPAGIDCGLTCSHAFDPSTSVLLTASAASDSTFVGWSGDCSGTGTCTVTMDADKAVTANFEQNQQTFVDVPPDYWAAAWIVRLYQAGITSGCETDPLRYCPEDPVTRAQMAVFLERGMQGSTYTPPTGTGTVFADVPLSYWAVDWIEQFYADGTTSGCGTHPLIYCPDDPVTRAQMAVFLLRARNGATYTPPEVGESTGYNDVPVDYWAAAWIKQLAAENITNGCGNGNYCPENPVTRAEMAVFLVRAFNLP